MRLDELFNKIADWKWLPGQTDPAIGGFIIGDQLYQVKIWNSRGEISVEFTSQHVDDDWEGAETIRATGNGNQFEVFGTVIEIIIDFVDNNDVEVIKFGGTGDSRVKLYRRLIQAMGRYGWVLESETEHSDTPDGFDTSDFRLVRG